MILGIKNISIGQLTGSVEAYSTSKVWTLTQTTGAATIYVKFLDTAGNGSTCVSVTLADVAVYTCPALSGGTWVSVRGDAVYGTNGFCVQKYVPSNSGGLPNSNATASHWANINQNTAKSACASLGTGYHLITNPEWMTIATNIASVGSNWSGGSVGNGLLRRGHSDSSPDYWCPANISDANAYVQTNCTGLSSGNFDQRRTATLTTGGVVWDIGGNIRQWVDLYNATDKPSGGNSYTSFSSTTPSAGWPWSSLIPRNANHSFWNDTWNQAQGTGTVLPGNPGEGGAALRGSHFNGGGWGAEMAGVFSIDLTNSPTSASETGFRCTWTPP